MTVLYELNWSRSHEATTLTYLIFIINYLIKKHKGKNQVSCVFSSAADHFLQVQVESFTSMTLTSPHFSLFPLRQHAQTCHLHCSAFLTHSYDICSSHNGLKESPDPEVEGQVTSNTPSGTGTWTRQPITSSEVVWPGLLSVLHHLLPV